MKRDWIVYSDDREDVRQAFAEVETIGHHIGGTFVLGTVRIPQPKENDASPDAHETVAWRIHFDSFVPSAKPIDANELDGTYEPTDADVFTVEPVAEADN